MLTFFNLQPRTHFCQALSINEEKKWSKENVICVKVHCCIAETKSPENIINAKSGDFTQRGQHESITGNTGKVTHMYHKSAVIYSFTKYFVHTEGLIYSAR